MAETNIAASDIAAWDYDTSVVLRDMEMGGPGGQHMLAVRLESQEDPHGVFMAAWLSVEQAEGLAESLATYIAEVKRNNETAGE